MGWDGIMEWFCKLWPYLSICYMWSVRVLWVTPACGIAKDVLWTWFWWRLVMVDYIEWIWRMNSHFIQKVWGLRTLVSICACLSSFLINTIYIRKGQALSTYAIYITSSFNFTMFHFGIFSSVYILANYTTWRFQLLDLHMLYPLKCQELIILTVPLFLYMQLNEIFFFQNFFRWWSSCLWCLRVMAPVLALGW